MRSCEYLALAKNDERRTECIRKRNIIFWLNHKLLSHDSLVLAQADTVSIRFEFQKNQNRNEKITQRKTDDPTMCPVRAAVAIVQRLNKMKAAGLPVSEESFIHLYMADNGKLASLTQAMGRQMLKTFLLANPAKIDFSSLGITVADVGLHSLRSSAAMAMYMNKVETFKIMKMGRWSSDAFVVYIRQQVEEFGSDVAKKMIRSADFHTVEDTHFDDPRNRIRSQQPGAVTASTHNGGNSFPAAHSAFDVWSNVARNDSIDL